LLLRELQLPWTLPAILKTFSEALAEGNPIVLPGAMEALAVFGSEDALAALIAALASGDRDAVNHAAALIGKRGGARAQEALTALLRHPDAAHRRSAVRGLLLMDTEPARDILRRHRATEQDPGVLELLEDLR
jgi:HEAT repeat protein